MIAYHSIRHLKSVIGLKLRMHREYEKELLAKSEINSEKVTNVREQIRRYEDLYQALGKIHDKG